jgi:hypothetical protein
MQQWVKPGYLAQKQLNACKACLILCAPSSLPLRKALLMHDWIVVICQRYLWALTQHPTALRMDVCVVELFHLLRVQQYTSSWESTCIRASAGSTAHTYAAATTAATNRA